MNKIRIEHTKNPYKISFNGVRCFKVTLAIFATDNHSYSVNIGKNGTYCQTSL